MLWHCWLGVRKSFWPVKIDWWSVGMVICLEQGADDLLCSSWCYCHLIICCFFKIQIGVTFLVPTYPGSPGKEAIKWVSALSLFAYWALPHNGPCCLPPLYRLVFHWTWVSRLCWVAFLHLFQKRTLYCVSQFIGRPFVKWFTLCLSVNLSVCMWNWCIVGCCGQTVGCIRLPPGMEAGLGPGHIVLDGDPASL